MSNVSIDVAWAGYQRLFRKRLLILVLLSILIAGSLCLDLVTGPSDMNVAEAVQALLSPDSVAGPASVIVWEVRLPYALMALLVGAALSLAGAEMQTILDNPLASPFTLGMSSAAIFGAALAIVLNIGIPGVPASWVISANAFACAFGSVLLLQALGRARNAGPEALVLFGIALFFTFNALVAIMQFMATEQALQQLVFWTMGSLGRSNWETVQVTAIALALVAPFSMAASWKMTALRLGDERAQTFGINVRRLRLASLF